MILPSLKANLCSQCHGDFRLPANGSLYKHGHRAKPCSGSGTVPVAGSLFHNSQSFGAHKYSMNRSQSLDSSTFSHLTRSAAVIKRIPWSAIAIQPCSALLSALIDDDVRHVDSSDKWSLL